MKELHAELMWKSFVEHISVLLHSSEVEVSYFAAGIIAHLMSRGEEAWTLSTSLRTSLLQQLVRHASLIPGGLYKTGVSLGHFHSRAVLFCLIS